MGPEKRFWTFDRSSWGFRTLRIFLEGSRPPQLNFFNAKKAKNREKVQNLVNKSAPARNAQPEPRTWGPQVAPSGPMGPMGPMGAHGGPMGAPRGVPWGLPYSPSWVNRALFLGSVAWPKALRMRRGRALPCLNGVSDHAVGNAML